MRKSIIMRCAMAATLLASQSPQVLGNDLEDPSVNVALQWNDAAVTAIHNSKTPPTQAARILAVVHAAMYDAWAAYDAVAVPSVAGGAPRQPQGLDPLNKASAISYAAYRTLVDLIPSQAAFFRTVMVNNLAYDPSITTTSAGSPPGIGNAAAAAQLAFRHRDGSNQLGDLGGAPYSDYTGYQAVNSPDLVTDPNRWQPLRAPDGSVQEFLSPHWGKVTPFALQSADQFRPAQPPQAGNWLYIQRMRDALQRNAELDDVAKTSAEYWEDATGSETAPGHWNRIAEEISARDLHTLDQDIKMFFALNQAMLDASIATWDAKRIYDSIRPVSVIRYFFNGQMIQGFIGAGSAGNSAVPGANWQPWTATPSYPEFPSDNSAFANAGSEILKRFTGSDVYVKQVKFAAGSSRYDPGVSPANAKILGWFTFSQIAEGAQTSSLPGGTQFDDAGLQGGIMGRAVGGAAWDRYNQLLNGLR
jgi:hypothetical protein